MKRPLLKICGLMREADVALCCRAGVDICGFVTEYPVPVPWNLRRERCAELLSAVRGKTKSCVVTGGTKEKIRDLIFALRPDYVQLHGGETIEVTAALCAAFASLGIGVIKTVPFTEEARLREFGTADPAECARMLDAAGVFAALVDARGPENAADAKLQADTELFQTVRSASRCPVILGGGVKSGNCAELIARLHPAALDVMTGVERAPGEKSGKMLHALLAEMDAAAR